MVFWGNYERLRIPLSGLFKNALVYINDFWCKIPGEQFGLLATSCFIVLTLYYNITIVNFGSINTFVCILSEVSVLSHEFNSWF